MKKLLVVFLLLAGCRAETPNDLNGYVEGEYVYIAPYAGGILDEINVVKGQQVSVGDRLFSVDREIWEASLAQAQNDVDRAYAALANLSKGKRKEELDVIIRQKEQAAAALENAEREYKRAAKLIVTNSVSKSVYDSRLTDYRTAKAKVAELESSLETAMLSAREDELKAARIDIETARQNLLKVQKQADGMSVSSKVRGQAEDVFFRLGEYVRAGSPVVSILPPENVKVRFYVPESRLASVKLNMPVRVFCDGCGDGIDASVTFISTKSEFTPPVIYSVESREKLVFMIEAAFDDKAQNLRPGQPVTVRIENDG